MVHALVDSYISNPRTIILAVIQAGNDIANQPIIQKSRQHDKSGLRTVGIITKPDLVNKGTEGRIALLAKNQDSTKLKLGYFLVKNPAPAELSEGVTADQRSARELLFFKTSPWKELSLDYERVGIVALRIFLQNLLDKHIERELPKVRREIKILLESTEEAITLLGDERPSAGHHRMFLSRIAMHLHNLIISALNGAYHEVDAKFFEQVNLEDSTRLRALVHRRNTEFADFMRDFGEKRKVIQHQSPDDETDFESDEEDDNPQILVTESKMKAWVKEVCDYPDRCSRLILEDLCEQSWQGAPRKLQPRASLRAFPQAVEQVERYRV